MRCSYYTYCLINLLSISFISLTAAWKITNDTDKNIFFIEDQSEAVKLAAGQTKTFSFKPHTTFLKYCLKKQFEIYEENQPDIFNKKYLLKEKECSDNLDENTFSISQIVKKDEKVTERFIVQTFDK